MCNFCHDYCVDIIINYLMKADIAQVVIKYSVTITRGSIFIKAMIIINYTY
jgi:hypothetical protein